LANIPLLGQTLLEYWLSYLALRGAESVLVLTSDRPEEAEALVGSGARWGLEARVCAETQELTPEEARAKYFQEVNSSSPTPVIEILDHFPGFPRRLFGGYTEFYNALQVWMSFALTPERVGMREVSARIWAGANSRISLEAELHPPCWIGQHAVVGPRAIVGPGSIIEDGVVMEAAAEISASWIGSYTFVGRLARINKSLAWGNRLVNWQTGSSTLVPDPFILSASWRPQTRNRRKWFRRLGELYSSHKSQGASPWQELIVPGAGTDA